MKEKTMAQSIIDKIINDLNNRVAMQTPVKQSTVAMQTPVGGLANKNFKAGAEWQANLLKTKTPKTGWFGKGGYIDTGANVFNALSGVANAYTGYKSLGLAQDEFKFNKGLASTNLANQASLINEQRLKAAKVGNALAGGTMTTAQKQNYLNDIKAGNVSGTI